MTMYIMARTSQKVRTINGPKTVARPSLPPTNATQQVGIEALVTLVTRLANRDAPRTEANIQADVRQLLLSAPLNLHSEDLQEIVLEAQAGGGRRIDVEVGTTAIEVKKDLRNPSVIAAAVPQLSRYVVQRQKKFGRRYVGILTDGAKWICYHLERGDLVDVTSIEIATSRPDVNALLIWLEGVLATARDIKPAPDEIETRLGAGSSSHALDRASLAELFEQNRTSPLMVTKRKLWARLLATALGTQFVDTDALFVEHTLLVSIAGIIAHAALGLEPEKAQPRTLLSGEKFETADVFGVVEADFFDWVVHIPNGEAFVRTLARRIARFDWHNVEHDVLKTLYESVISAEVRKQLGEYYTPDWLAEAVVESTLPDPLNTRVLDPACGSGTFVFHAVRRYLAAADAAGVDPQRALSGVTRSVIGMDLHPVAVTLARVTYLLALGTDRLSNDRGAVRIPIFLGDSLQWYERDKTLFTTKELRVPVDDELGPQRQLLEQFFIFPNDLLQDFEKFEELVSEMANLAVRERKVAGRFPSLKAVFSRHAIPEAVQPVISATFNLMCQLHDQGRDHIWGYYIRNLARPEWLTRGENQVDLLIGNPPWLAYRYMSPTMKREFRSMSDARALWHGAKLATNQDLSALFVVRAMELYLKRGGRFAFVMPNAVLDRPTYEGLRSGSFAGGAVNLSASMSTPWDLREIRPHFFPGTAAVVFGSRTTRPTRMPATSERWKGKLKNARASWTDVASQLTRERGASERGAEGALPRSPYHSRFRQGASIVPRVLFVMKRVAASRLGLKHGRVAVTSVRSANEKPPWKDLSPIQVVVEREFLHPLQTSISLLPFRLKQAEEVVLPVGKKSILDPGAIESAQGLAKWWSQAQAVWEKNRSNDRLSLRQQIDFQGKLSEQIPVAKERVIYNTSGMHIVAARLRDTTALVDTSLYWAALSSEDEALYLCAILNAQVTSEKVRPFMAYGKDERHVHRRPWEHLAIPAFAAANPLHKKLANLAKTLEDIAGSVPLSGKHFSAERRQIRNVLAASEPGVALEQAVSALLV